MSAATPGPQRPARGPLIALLIAALAATVALTVLAAGAEDAGKDDTASSSLQGEPFRGNPLPPELAGRPAPQFRLRDARGGWLRSSDLRGRPYTLTFLYTNCPDVCPLIGQELRQALELLGRQADRVEVAAVSVDPEGDTAEAVQTWLRRMRLPANFHYLIGAEGQLRPLWKAYFAAPQQPDADQSLHTASIWLIDARGRWRTKFSGGAPVAPADLAHDLRVLLREDHR
jgi:protein SCO1/2